MLRLLQRATPLFAACAVLFVGQCGWPYTVDDAFIVARYAVRLASGLGYTSSGNQPSDGVTGPLWLLPGILAARLQLDPVLMAKCWGLVAMAVAVALAVQRLGLRSRGRRMQLVAFTLCAGAPTFGTWGVAGLETGFATLALVVALLGVTTRPHPWRVRAGVAIAALAWLRPELAVASCVLLVGLHQRIGRRAWPAWLLAAASGVSVCVFRSVLFHDLWPLAFYAKHGTLADGVDYALRACFVLTGGLGSVAALFASIKGRADDRVAGAMLVAHVGAVVLAGGDWMPGFRLFAPVLPAYAMLVASAAERLSHTRRGLVAALAMLLLASAVPLVDLVTRVPDLRAAGSRRDVQGARLADYLHAHASTVALVDIGYLGTKSGLDLVDLAGVTDPEIAHLPGGHLDKRIPDALLVRRAPDAIVLHSQTLPEIDAQGRLRSLRGYPVERRVAASAWVQRRFRTLQIVHYAPHYFYAVLLRDDRLPSSSSP